MHFITGVVTADADLEGLPPSHSGRTASGVTFFAASLRSSKMFFLGEVGSVFGILEIRLRALKATPVVF